MRLPRRLVATVLVAALVSTGCIGSSEKTEVPEATATTAVTAVTVVTAATAATAATATPTQVLATATPTTTVTQMADTPKPSGDAVFWNAPTGDRSLPACDKPFRFTHPIVELTNGFQMWFGPGSHVAPHNHMAYWGTPGLQEEELNNPDKSPSNSDDEKVVQGPTPTPISVSQQSERVQIYAPADVFKVDLRRAVLETQDGGTYVEWGGYLFLCDSHVVMLGHVDQPSDELVEVLREIGPASVESRNCSGTIDEVLESRMVGRCRWNFNTFIPAGTPLILSSGYFAGFDFGLQLVGLTAEELQKHPSYGYSMTPWRVGSGNAVCPLEYFPEPYRTDYLALLGAAQCGPFNQDVPGTAMGHWFPTPSPDEVPIRPDLREVDEFQTVWLFEDSADPTLHMLKVGDDSYGLGYNQYGFTTRETGPVNRRWDEVVPGGIYCAEVEADDTRAVVLVELTADGLSLKIEGLDRTECNDGLSFGNQVRTFYR